MSAAVGCDIARHSIETGYGTSGRVCVAQYRRAPTSRLCCCERRVGRGGSVRCGFKDAFADVHCVWHRGSVYVSWRPIGEVLLAQLGDVGGLLESDCVVSAFYLDVQQVGDGPLVLDEPALFESRGEMVVEGAAPGVLVEDEQVVHIATDV